MHVYLRPSETVAEVDRLLPRIKKMSVSYTHLHCQAAAKEARQNRRVLFVVRRHEERLVRSDGVRTEDVLKRPEELGLPVGTVAMMDGDGFGRITGGTSTRFDLEVVTDLQVRLPTFDAGLPQRRGSHGVIDLSLIHI